MTVNYRELYARLNKVQNALSVPKNHFNSFGGYSFRNAEDIEKAAKPILMENELTMYTTYSMEEHCGHPYVCALVTIGDGDAFVSATALAREADQQKGMVAPQLSGSAHSYAKKYAMCALLGIDDGIDADTENNGNISDKYSEPINVREDNHDSVKRLAWENIKRFASQSGLDPMVVLNDIKARPEFVDNDGFWTAISIEFGE